MKDIRAIACRRVRELRHRSGLTQGKFAKLCNLSPDAIAQIERLGATPALETIGKICDGLGIGPREFFEGIGENPPSREKEKALRDIATYLKGKNAGEIRRIHKMAALALER